MLNPSQELQTISCQALQSTHRLSWKGFVEQVDSAKTEGWWKVTKVMDNLTMWHTGTQDEIDKKPNEYDKSKRMNQEVDWWSITKSTRQWFVTKETRLVMQRQQVINSENYETTGQRSRHAERSTGCEDTITIVKSHCFPYIICERTH